MPDLAAEIDIPAPPATVWQVLLDVEAYPQWNTLLRVADEYRPGGRVRARLSVPGLPTVPLRPTITTLDPERELRWRSELFGHDADHTFRLTPIDDGTGTRFSQSETIDGPLAGPVVGRLERQLHRGFEQMNVGLRRHCLDRLDGQR